MMRIMGRASAWVVGGAGLLLALSWSIPSVAFQRNTPSPSTSPNYSPTLGTSSANSNSIPPRMGMGDDPMLRQMDERRGKAINTERQRMMIKDADLMVQAAADLQASVVKGIEGSGREDQAKRAESIEKLAKDVKERMKGGR